MLFFVAPWSLANALFRAFGVCLEIFTGGKRERVKRPAEGPLPLPLEGKRGRVRKFEKSTNSFQNASTNAGVALTKSNDDANGKKDDAMDISDNGEGFFENYGDRLGNDQGDGFVENDGDGLGGNDGDGFVGNDGNKSGKRMVMELVKMM
jgi:hypothetical protein